MKTPALVLVATPIGNLGDLSARATDELRAADVIAAEDSRRTRALLSAAGIPGGNRLRAVHAHNEQAQAPRLVQLIRDGNRVVYVSDAGMPGIADPGERLVRACLDAELLVEVVPGPSALLTALVISGLPTSPFRFVGFLPRKGAPRRARLSEIAAAPETVVIFESPHRVAATVAALAEVCAPDREVAIARELSKLFEEVVRGSLAEVSAQLTHSEARGEHVIVIGPAAPAGAVADDSLARAAEAALAGGVTARDAAAAVARDLGVSRRRAYDAVLRARNVRRG
ncbi:MAG: 16S rRNA (cytidine(1402)-2'-O)-methyltransferase [Actinomycetota bacterium]